MLAKFRHHAWMWLYQNPVISRDFILNLRKGRYFFLMALLLIFGTFGITWQWSQDHPAGTPIGRQLFFAYVSSELLVILFLLPGLVANSIIIERDRKILPMLLATPLGPGRILFGKTVSTAGLLVLLLISTYPLITICMARGGVSPLELIGGCLLILYAGWAIAAFALYNALRSVNTFRAVIATQFSIVFCYCILLPIISLFFFFASNIVITIFRVFFDIFIFSHAQALSYVAAIFNIIFLLLIPIAMFRFSIDRMNYLDPRTRSNREMLHGIEFQFHQQAQKEQQEHSYWAEGLKWNPFYVREYMGMLASRNPYAIPIWYFIAIIGHTFLWISIFNGGKYLGIAALIILAQVIPSYSAGLFAGERENESWELLITTCSKPITIMKGKLQFALRQTFTRAMGLYLIPVTVGAMLHLFIQWARSEPATALPFLAECSLLFVHLTFVTVFIAFISARQNSLYSTYGFSYLLISVYLFGPLILQPFTASPWMNESFLSLSLYIINPIILMMQSPGGILDQASLTSYWWIWLFQISFYILCIGFLLYFTHQQLCKEENTKLYN